jgi:hypothetical protein
MQVTRRPGSAAGTTVARRPITVYDSGERIEALGATNLDAFVLARVERFALLAVDPRVRGVPAWRRLADHALDAALVDCAAQGLVDEALAILVAALGHASPPGPG